MIASTKSSSTAAAITVGVYTRANFSTHCSDGARRDCASPTIRMMRARVVSPAGFVDSTSRAPSPAGDTAIRHVADMLRQDRRETDLPARLGGEEFAVILPGTDILGGARIAEKVCQNLASSPVQTVGTVTASFGVATFPEDGHEAKDLMKKADERLYSAKGAGRNQVCYVTIVPDVPESTTSRLSKVELPEPGEDPL